MALSGNGLVKKANTLELEGRKNCKIVSDSWPELDELLDDVFVSRRPRPIDYAQRIELVRIFNAIAKELFGKTNDYPVVEVFGSFVMDMFSSGSDLDLSVNFSSLGAEVPRHRKIQVLKKFSKKFYSLQRRGHVSGIQVITTARVPIVKVIDQGTGVECDLSVENRDGILKSQIIHFISMIDERFQKLSLLMKSWAKAHDINSSKDRTLSSISIISLVAFHLQTRDPPILPPFNVLLKDGTSPSAVMKMVQNYKGYGKENKESVGKLFVTLVAKMASVEKMWKEGLCASLYEASWIVKSSDSEFGSITVEDFTEKSQNFARAVGTEGFRKIYSLINVTLDVLLGFLNGQSQKSTLRDSLFGMDSVVIKDKVVKNLSEITFIPPIEQGLVKKKLTESTSDITIEHGPHQMKNRQLTGLVDQQAAKDGNGAMTANKLAGKQMTKGREEVNLPTEHDSHQKKKRRLTGRVDKQAAKDGTRTMAAKKLAGEQMTKGTEEVNLSTEHDSHQMKKRRFTGLVDKQAAKDGSGTMAAKKLAGKQMAKAKRREEVNLLNEHDSHQKKKIRLTGGEDKRAANSGNGGLAPNRWTGKQITNGREETTHAKTSGSNFGGSQFVQSRRGTLPSQAFRGAELREDSRQEQSPNGWGYRQQPGSWRANVNGWMAAQQVDDWGIRTNATVNSWGVNWQQDNRGTTFQENVWAGGPWMGGWGRALQHEYGWGIMRPNYGETLNPIAAQWPRGVNSSMPFVPTYRPIGFEGSYNETLHPHLVSPRHPLPSVVSHSVNLNALPLYLGQALPQHAPPSHNELFRR